MPNPLPQIASTSWEHPADRAALNTLRAIPGFDEIVRQVATFLTERRVRQIFLANAVQVSPVQRPRLDALLTDVLTTLDWPKRPELYVTQSPKVNAYAIGFEDPFIVMTSGALELLESDDERRFLLAHELGHIMSDHMTYRTIAMVLVTVGSLALLPVGIALLPFQLALLEWHRKSEFSSDRAALLAIQDRAVAGTTFMRLAGGRDYGDTTSVDAFMTQAATYESGGDTWDKILKSELPPALPLMALRSTIVYPLGTIAVQMGAPENLSLLRTYDEPGLVVALVVALEQFQRARRHDDEWILEADGVRVHLG